MPPAQPLIDGFPERVATVRISFPREQARERVTSKDGAFMAAGEFLRLQFADGDPETVVRLGWLDLDGVNVNKNMWLKCIASLREVHPLGSQHRIIQTFCPAIGPDSSIRRASAANSHSDAYYHVPGVQFRIGVPSCQS